jgi:AraC family transcriptional regulator
MTAGSFGGSLLGQRSSDEGGIMDYEVTVKELPAQLALTVHRRVTMATIGQAMGEAFGAIMAHVAAGGAQYAGPPFAFYPGEMADEYEVVICAPVAPGATAGPGVALEEVPGGPAATTMHEGPYDGVGGAYGALQTWMTENGRLPGGPPRETYLNEPGTVPDAELLTEIAWPIA